MSIMWPLCLACLCGRARSVYSAPPRNAGNCLHCLLQPLASSVLLFLDAHAHINSLHHILCCTLLKAQWCWCYGCSPFLFMASEQLWMEAGLASEFVLLNP